MFSLEETSTGNGYQIVVRDDGNYTSTLAYCWNKKEPDQKFLDLLELVGIKFPEGDK